MRLDLIKKLLEGKEKLVLALDKWTNNHHEKFIGVYVYQKGKSIFLGLINYDFSCGAKEMKKYTKELLAKFGIAKERLACVMSDCGSDMVKFCRIMKLAHVPCLAHVINLIVKKLINASLIHDDAIETDNEVAIQTDEEIVIQNEDSNNENDTDEADEDFDTLNTRSIEPFGFSNFVNEIRQAVKDIRTPNNNATFMFMQKQFQKSELDVVLDNETRWNSTYLMLERFLKLCGSVEKFYHERRFDWQHLDCLVKVLKPFYEVTLELQKKEIPKDFDFYLKTVEYVRTFVECESGLEMVRDDMLQLLDKWCGSKNAVVQAFNKRDKLYKRLAKEIDDNIENLQQTEHTYATPTSFKDFLQLERAVGPKEEQIRRTLRQIPATIPVIIQLYISVELFCFLYTFPF